MKDVAYALKALLSAIGARARLTLRFLAVLAGCPDRSSLLDLRGDGVVECCGDHFYAHVISAAAGSGSS